MRNRQWSMAIGLGVAVMTVVGAQGQSTVGSGPAHRAAAPAAPPLGSIKELMDGIVDPTAEIIFDAVSYEATSAGIKETMPHTDHDWAEVRRHALLLVEVSNLLKMPGRRVAPANPFLELEADEKGPKDLTPAEIQTLVDRDRSTFVRLAGELGQAAALALKAADAKNVDALFESGDAIDKACENCHVRYWYPEDKRPSAGSLSQRKK